MGREHTVARAYRFHNVTSRRGWVGKSGEGRAGFKQREVETGCRPLRLGGVRFRTLPVSSVRMEELGGVGGAFCCILHCKVTMKDSGSLFLSIFATEVSCIVPPALPIDTKTPYK